MSRPPGILQREMARQNPPPEDAALEAPEELLPGQEPATPEEQEALDQAVVVAMKAMTAKGALDRLLSLVKTAGLERGIAQTVVATVEQVDQRLDVPETVILAFATEVATIAWAACARARMVKEDDAQGFAKVMTAVYSGLAELYEFDPEEAAQIMQQMAGAEGGAMPQEPAQQDPMTGAADGRNPR